MSRRSYCYVCGNAVREISESSWFCDHCQQEFFENPKPCVELAIFDSNGRILLAKRADEPWKGKYDLPGGFMELEESAEEALLRELDEELGLKAEDLTKPVLVKSWVSEYPYGIEVLPVVTFTFRAQLIGKPSIEPADDVAAVEFRNPKDISKEEISTPQGYETILQAAQDFQ